MLTKQKVCKIILSTKNIGTQDMKKTNKTQELKEILQDLLKYANALRNDPNNDKIINALYSYQIWSLKQAEKTVTLIERIRNNNKQK